ncbi:MAG: peptidylprolyl isomerase [Lysobacteraceae bacterium]|jgi:FKBP-type peptidyl-prolyl cis-trans isomerase SlyD|nr:peptidylprolyl isomerase [Xanthomonadaceae bacterium]MCZ8318249.1 peptidylprolyl isomerase [Silanimonas sp.]
MQIAERTVASFHYTLTSPDGQVIDSSRGRDPLPYLHGVGHIVPGLEKAMVGRVAGDTFQIVVPASEGYGEHNPEMMQAVPRAAFPAGIDIEPGMQFEAQGPMGPITVVVKAVDAEAVTIDANHPLAGMPLHFDIEVVEVREASVEEVLHGHVHGPGGHPH